MCQRGQETWTWSSPKLLILQMSKYASKHYWFSLFKWVSSLLFNPSSFLFAFANSRPLPELASLWLQILVCADPSSKRAFFFTWAISNTASTLCPISMLLVKVIYLYFYSTLGIFLWQIFVCQYKIKFSYSLSSGTETMREMPYATPLHFFG